MLTGMAISGYAQAAPTPLSAAELAQCAEQVQTLRTKSAHLHQENAEFERRRADITARSSELKDRRRSPAQTDIQANINQNKKMLDLNVDTAKFNAEIQQFRSAVAALNVVKENYDATCSGRPYRRSDFANLAPAARAAMQAGLSDIRVPYTQTLKPLPTQNAQ